MELKKKEEKMRKMRKERMEASLKKTMVFLCMAFVFAVSSSAPVFANAQAITSKFDILKDIIAAIVSAIGVLVTLWGLFELGNSMQTQEGGALSQAMKRIGGGLVMVVGPQLLALLV